MGLECQVGVAGFAADCLVGRGAAALAKGRCYSGGGRSQEANAGAPPPRQVARAASGSVKDRWSRVGPGAPLGPWLRSRCGIAMRGVAQSPAPTGCLGSRGVRYPPEERSGPPHARRGRVPQDRCGVGSADAGAAAAVVGSAPRTACATGWQVNRLGSPGREKGQGGCPRRGAWLRKDSYVPHCGV